MSTYRGQYSGSGKDPIPAKGSFNEDDKQDTGAQKQPKADRDYAGAMSAKNPTKGSIYLGESDADPKADDKQFWGKK